MTSSVCAADLLKEWNHERNLLRGTRLFSAWHHMSSLWTVLLLAAPTWIFLRDLPKAVISGILWATSR